MAAIEALRADDVFEDHARRCVVEGYEANAQRRPWVVMT